MTCWSCGVRRQQQQSENSSSCFPSVCEQWNNPSCNLVPCNLVQKQCTVLVSWHQHVMITAWLSPISCLPSYHFPVWPSNSLHQSALPLTFLSNASSHLSSIASLIVLRWACVVDGTLLSQLTGCIFVFASSSTWPLTLDLSVGLKEFIDESFPPHSFELVWLGFPFPLTEAGAVWCPSPVWDPDSPFLPSLSLFNRDPSLFLSHPFSAKACY